jgi:phosphatidylglycerophosphate synthase
MKVLCYLLAACAIQLRLLCNLFDGMVAIESGFKTHAGEIFNDFPDRISDPLVLVSAGYSIPSFEMGAEIGWLAGTLAILTAYVRVLGGSAGATQLFMGPMAKQHRMAVMTGALVVAATAVRWGHQEIVLFAALKIICLGCLFTVIRRLVYVVKELEGK